MTYCKTCNERLASFGFKGEKATLCGKCRLPGMINVKVRLCKHEGCGKQPSFGFPNEKAVFCATHKEEGMYNNKSRICDTYGCKLTPCFIDTSDGWKAHCLLHSNPEMKCFKKLLARRQSSTYL